MGTTVYEREKLFKRRFNIIFELPSIESAEATFPLAIVQKKEKQTKTVMDHKKDWRRTGLT